MLWGDFFFVVYKKASLFCLFWVIINVFDFFKQVLRDNKLRVIVVDEKINKYVIR